VTATTHPIQGGAASYFVLSHWDRKTAEPMTRFNVAVASVPCCVTPDRNGKRVIVAGARVMPWMAVFSLESGRCLYEYQKLRGTPLCLAVAPRNNRLLASLGDRLQVFTMESI